jgi:hypothetical protein
VPASVTWVSAQGAREEHPLTSLLGDGQLEQVATETYQWIKRLRLVPYAGGTMRERFSHREDSLWWFTELYLHKTRRMEDAVRTVIALDAACAAQGPVRLEVATTSAVERAAALAFGRSRNVPVTCVPRRPGARVATAGWWPSYSIGLTARLSRLRRPVRVEAHPPARVAAFVHTAFWGGAVPSPATPLAQESYIGPVLSALAERIGERDLTCVGLGPRRNFRARRWWDPLSARRHPAQAVIPIEAIAPRAALAPALALWRRRHVLARDLVAGEGIRSAGIVRGCDLWDVLRAELIDVARLQWPWSVRAMDEAGAALDALAPRVALTYAEAGGWGRALVLEARRRGVPSVGLQHGFIYRHWLNYLHEPDELVAMGPDRGFPHPDRTLLFDAHGARHLAGPGRLPPETLRVTGSPGRDRLVEASTRLRTDNREAIRRELGVEPDEHLLVLAAKFTEIQGDLPELFRAVEAAPSVRLVVKTHPAETAQPYAALAAGARRITIAQPSADLARLLAAADALVTRNSTVAIDALVLELPALVLGLPNNLSPFVEAGAMVGVAEGGLNQALERVLYDREAREAIVARARQFTAGGGMPADGRAAERAVDEILALT